MCEFTQTYPTDLKYTERQEISEFFSSSDTGHPPKWERWRSSMEFCMSIARDANGVCCQSIFRRGRPYISIYWRWKRQRLWEWINEVLVKQVRKKAGRDERPSAIVIGSDRQPEREDFGRRRSTRRGCAQADPEQETALGRGRSGASPARSRA